MADIKAKLLSPGANQRDYLAGLNTCFGHWGSIVEYKWCFDRAFNQHKPERLGWFDNDDRLVAGSGISYRDLVIGGHNLTVGVMTGSWTLPECRGRGIFKDAISKSLECSIKESAVGLAAFVTADNPSAKALVAAGSKLVASHYCFAEPYQAESIDMAMAMNFRVLSPSEMAQCLQDRNAKNTNANRFCYQNDDDMRWQFLSRPNPVLGVQIGKTRAILEVAPRDLRVLCLVVDDDNADTFEILRQIASAMGKNIFIFTTCGRPPSGYGFKNGFVTILPKPGSILDELMSQDTKISSDWFIESGDRI